MDRRAVFFVVAAAVVAAIVPVTPDKFSWLPVALSITYVVLAVGSFLDSWSTHRGNEPRPDRRNP